MSGSTPALSGTVTGYTRAELVNMARENGSRYFEVGSEKVWISLRNERIEERDTTSSLGGEVLTVVILFAAEFEAWVEK